MKNKATKPQPQLKPFQNEVKSKCLLTLTKFSLASSSIC